MGKYEQLIKKCDIYPGHLNWLQNIEFPKPREKSKLRKLPIIEVGADGMRVGKTTAVKVLVQGIKKTHKDVRGSFEEFTDNPYLKSSYQDPKKSILNSQKWFISNKYNQLKSAPKDKIFIQDVNPEMDFCYAVSNTLMGRMSLHQFEKYLVHYNSLNWSAIPQPDLLIYLKVSDEILLKRVKKSLREFETVDEKYFLIMKLVNRTWFDKVKIHMNTLEIDTDNLDYSKDKKAKIALTKKVIKSLNYD